jgi:hypothetical protein
MNNKGQLKVPPKRYLFYSHGEFITFINYLLCFIVLQVYIVHFISFIFHIFMDTL